MNKSKSKYKRIKLDNNNDIKKINIGLQLLRSICSLLIIIFHSYNFHHYKIILSKNRYYLILFFYMSFYFSYNTLASRNISKIKGRFKRMIIKINSIIIIINKKIFIN